MTAIEIARRMAELGQTKDAVTAYNLVLHEGRGKDPAVDMEAALYLLQNGGDYKVSYSIFVELHRKGAFREDCLSLMTQAFYTPNVKLLKTRYENNCRLLAKYPYLFRKDFLDFAFLPICFYPFDDNCFTPYFVREERFGDFVDVKKPVVTRNFFKDLEKPVLAEDVFSQYELEYLNDSVRPSEWVARENHIYLHYPDWPTFCAWLQVLNMRPLLEQKKFVFLIGDEIEQYPIDFKERFGIEYDHHSVKPVGIREINRLIWHTQLSSHNGGDFFNEIFDAHPNLLALPSLMFDSMQENVAKVEEVLKDAESSRQAVKSIPEWEPRLVEELYLLRDRTEKDILVAFFLQRCIDYEKKHKPCLDRASRIAPVLFFQPHFSNIVYTLHVHPQGWTQLDSQQYEAVRTSPLFRNFKYIKTFTPLRRFTTSHGATVKFMSSFKRGAGEEQERAVVPDAVSQRVLNRSFMIDWQDRLYTDSVLIRFEDAKLNPKATFIALAAFLDIPYTESMTYCSQDGEIDPESMEGNVRGFSTEAVYRTYDGYANEAEKTYIEYFLRDAYEYYGYDLQYYDGGEMDEERIKTLVKGFTTINKLIADSWGRAIIADAKVSVEGASVEGDIKVAVADGMVKKQIETMEENRITNAKVLMRGLYFLNRHGQPLHMMPKLKLDEALLEQPLYH